MAMSSPPHGYHTVNPYVVVDDVQGLMAFLAAVFNGTERELIRNADGTIGHAEMEVGDSVIMLSDGRAAQRTTRSEYYLFVDDVDAAYRRALDAGAMSRSAPGDKFYGNREAGVSDRWGNVWWIATAFEEVPAERLQALHDARGTGETALS